MSEVVATQVAAMLRRQPTHCGNNIAHPDETTRPNAAYVMTCLPCNVVTCVGALICVGHGLCIDCGNGVRSGDLVWSDDDPALDGTDVELVSISYGGRR